MDRLECIAEIETKPSQQIRKRTRRDAKWEHYKKQYAKGKALVPAGISKAHRGATKKVKRAGKISKVITKTIKIVGS